MASPESSRVLSLAELEDLCARAVRSVGGSAELAASLASAVVAAERRGRSEVGAAHLVDYLDALRDGRLRGDADPRLVRSAGAVILVDADEGAAQLAFDRAEPHLVERARAHGIAALSMHSCFSAGELGLYASRLAEKGLVAMACSNSPALMSVYGARTAVTGTNPLAFALPHASGPRMFDQASSATAWVTVRDAARRGERIPDGWAIDRGGDETSDAVDAMDGALLPFGGVKGANIAMMVEMLAAMSGGLFSLDAPPFEKGDESPRLGLFALALDPSFFDPDYPERAERHLSRLAADHDADFGRRKTPRSEVEISVEVVDALRSAVDAADETNEERR